MLLVENVDFPPCNMFPWFAWCPRLMVCMVQTKSACLMCHMFLNWFAIFSNSPPSSEHIWQQNGSKASLTPQFSRRSNSRPVGSCLASPEFCVPVQDSSHLSPFQTKELQAGSLNSQENSSAGQQQNPITSTRAFLNHGGVNNQPLGEKPGAFMANNESPKMMRSPPDTSFLPHSFLASVSEHNSHNGPSQPHQGMNVNPQPPLPEKKWTSEGERSFGSVSPSSSGFSSPHSGSTISIPFPNILPDFSKVSNASPLPGKLYTCRDEF